MCDTGHKWISCRDILVTRQKIDLGAKGRGYALIGTALSITSPIEYSIGALADALFIGKWSSRNIYKQIARGVSF
jgi:hypothetical protein